MKLRDLVIVLCVCVFVCVLQLIKTFFFKYVAFQPLFMDSTCSINVKSKNE